MAEKKQTILEEALLDTKRIQEALQANTKEILRSIAREEIDGLVKESLNEADFEEEDAESEDVADVTNNDEAGETGTEEVTSDSEATELEPVVTNDETPNPTDDLNIGGEESTDALASALGNELDMTNASDDDVISVYKKLTGDDEIEVVGNDVHLTVSEPGEYVIKGAGAGKTAATEEPIVTDVPALDTELGTPVTDDETEYEIALGGDEEGGSDIESELTPVSDDEEVSSTEEELVTADAEGEEELDETIVKSTGQSGKAYSNLTDIKGAGARKEIAESKNNDSKLLTEATAKYNKLLTETTTLKKENSEFRNSLKTFRNMLVETVVFNSNLTYAVKLMTEHSTTAEEKKTILKRFDEEVSNLQESKKLYKTIKTELTSKKPVVESVEKKINNEIQSSGSKQLNESTAYVDKETLRIKDLMNRVEGKK